MESRITILPDVCEGKPTIRGFRLTVKTLLEHLSAGDSIDDLLEAYPFLEREDVLAALAFAATTVERNPRTFKIAR
ncbi:MAG: DUF433 domain-containing protein [Bacteroidota bacterium]